MSFVYSTAPIFGRRTSIGKQTFTVWHSFPGVGKRFVVRADEKLTAFIELESAIRGSPNFTPPMQC
jgi:hypothetical protein